ncbi:hypothetical protein EFA69_05375 [Rufibacter immobilis]|uniref:Uncharacterized protein n=1 Tax=Rufibacter immobilis TaxID=1348778 RepID=A0A3M9N2B8_9BACT|nr:hypothetical protein [Rufibacter immobilis]RNI31941.1 hypothetical protein EFA69_05375 [Rufibacter immobilis]
MKKITFLAALFVAANLQITTASATDLPVQPVQDTTQVKQTNKERAKEGAHQVGHGAKSVGKGTKNLAVSGAKATGKGAKKAGKAVKNTTKKGVQKVGEKVD